MAQEAIFGPFFATILLTLAVWVYMYIRRIRFLASNGGFPTSYMKNIFPPPPPIRLAFMGRDVIAMVEPPMMDLQCKVFKNADGAIAWFRFGSRLRQRQWFAPNFSRSDGKR